MKASLQSGLLMSLLLPGWFGIHRVITINGRDRMFRISMLVMARPRIPPCPAKSRPTRTPTVAAVMICKVGVCH